MESANVETLAAGRERRLAQLRSFAAEERVTLAGVLGLWLACAGYFATKQEIWVDETTQLSGLTLSPAEVARWLAGADVDRFGVPGDRAPPLGYWLGWLWSHVFGLTENAMRAFGMACVAVGLVFLVRAARTAFGPWAGWLAGLGLALSPNTIVSGVEIRSYPLYLGLSCVVAWALLRLLTADKATPRDFGLLAVACVLVSYTHFFGLVLTGVVFVALLPRVWRERTWRVPYAASFLGVSVLASGLVPFVLGAVHLDEGGAPAESPAAVPFSVFARDLVRFAYRLAGGHPAVAVQRSVVFFLLASFATLAGLALFAAHARGRTWVRNIALGVAAGLCASTAAKLLSTKFDAFSSTYNLWAYPLLALLVSAGLTASAERARKVAFLGMGGLVVANAAAAAMFLSQAECFTHTAAERLLAEIERAGGPQEVVVLHDGEWGYPFFPFHLVSKGQLEQYALEREPSGTLSLRSLARTAQARSLSALPNKRTLLVTSRTQNAEDLREYLRTAEAPRFADEHVRARLAREGMRGEGGKTLMAFGASEYEWFDR